MYVCMHDQFYVMAYITFRKDYASYRLLLEYCHPLLLVPETGCNVLIFLFFDGKLAVQSWGGGF